MSDGRSIASSIHPQLKKYYSFYTGGFIAFVTIIGLPQFAGVPNKILGYCFLAATILLYAGIGFMSKTAEVSSTTSRVAACRRCSTAWRPVRTGCRPPPSSGMAGTLYLSGYDGLAFVMGWTGGYCLVALFLAPYLRKFGQFTIPDFLGARYGGNIPRLIGVLAAIVCSFTYVIAQIYGVGLITSRFTGLEFTMGVFRRSRRHPGLLVPWRHEGGDLDAGGPVHHPDRGLHDPGGVAVGETHGQPDPAAVGLRLGAAEVTALEKEFNDKASPKGAKEKRFAPSSASVPRDADAKLKGWKPVVPSSSPRKEKLVGGDRTAHHGSRCQGDRGCRKGGQGLPGRSGRSEEGLDSSEGRSGQPKRHR